MVLVLVPNDLSPMPPWATLEPAISHSRAGQLCVLNKGWLNIKTLRFLTGREKPCSSGLVSRTASGGPHAVAAPLRAPGLSGPQTRSVSSSWMPLLFVRLLAVWTCECDMVLRQPLLHKEGA